MKLLYSIPLEEHEQPFSSPSYSYAGVLCVHDGQIIYCRQTYMENQPHLKEYVFTRDGQLLGSSLYPLPRPTELNDRWRYYASSAFSCIAIGQEWGFDLTTKTFSPMSDPLRATYVHDIHADEPYFYTDHVFHLPPYEIAHKGEFSYVCSREGHPVWTFRTRGYLYTDIVQYDDAVVFGTAGMGGHFIACAYPTDPRSLMSTPREPLIMYTEKVRSTPTQAARMACSPSAFTAPPRPFLSRVSPTTCAHYIWMTIESFACPAARKGIAILRCI